METFLGLLKEVLAYIERYKDVAAKDTLGVEMTMALVRSASQQRIDLGEVGREILYMVRTPLGTMANLRLPDTNPRSCPLSWSLLLS